MSNPESYARIPTSTLINMIAGLLDKTKKVCKAHTAAKLVAAYDDYRDSKWHTVEKLFGIKTKDFLAWVKAMIEDWKNASILCDSVYWECRDTNTFDGLINTMANLAKYSDQHALLADSDLEQLTRAIAKGDGVKDAEDYLAKLEAFYPGITELL